MAQIPPIEDAYIDSIIKSGGAYQPSLTKTQGVKLRELMKLLRDRFEQEITTLPAIIGVKAQNFRLSRVYITDNFGGEANAVSISAGELIHFEYSNADEQNVWQLQPLVHGGLAPELLYYVYCKCSKIDQSATYTVTTEEIKPEDEPGFYMFLAGVLYPVLDGYRDSDFTNGVADITGGRIKIGKILSRDGQTGFDLDNGTIFGKITFRNNAGDLKDIKEVETIADNAQATANDAQVSAETAIANAAAAQTKANNAKNQADTALEGLNAIANDGILDINEKTNLKLDLQTVNIESASVIAQATNYGISSATYQARLGDIQYCSDNVWYIATPVNTAVNRADFNIIWSGYYAARQAIFTAVTNQAKAIADSAQSSATTATNNAANALTQANNARSQAESALQELSDISNDGILDISEKNDIKQKFLAIQGEYAGVLAQAATYGVITDFYRSRYLDYLAVYIPPLLADMYVNSPVDRNLLNNWFVEYYNARQAVYTAVSDAAKANVDNISVGGRNYFQRLTPLEGAGGLTNVNHVISGDLGLSPWSISNGIFSVGTQNQVGGLTIHNAITSNGEWTVSGYLRSNTTLHDIRVDMCDGPYQVLNYDSTGADWQYFELTFNVFNYTTELYNFVDFANIPWVYFTLQDLKVEKGNKATDWTAAPEDLQASIDQANQNAVNSKNESIAASKLYADAQDILTRTETAAYADGIVDAEEARAIADAQTKLSEAKADSTMKANAAEAEAKALAKLLVDNINVGGRNYFNRNTVIQPGLGSNNIVRTERGFNVIGVDANVGLVRLIDVIKSNGYWTISFDVSVNAVLWQGSKVEINDVGAMEFDAPLNPNKQHVVLTINVQNWTAGVYNFVDLFDLSGQTYFFDNIKIEKGNKATDWTAAPEDLQADLDTAKMQAAQANQAIADLSNDNIVTPIEKNTLSQKYLDITNEYGVLVTQADTYLVDSSVYRSRFLDYLVPHLPGILADMNSNSAVNGAFLDEIFAEYYKAKISLLKAITDAANGKIIQNIDLINGKNYASGKMLYRDPEFAQGVNGINAYNNTGDGSVTVARQYLYGAPNRSEFVLRLNLSTSASPNLGGIYFATQSRANAIFIVRFYLAGLVGQTIEFASNAYGDGGSFKWNTSNVLVGGWQEVIGTIKCGSDGSFSSTAFFHFTGNTNPVYLASATVYDMTAAEVDYIADATAKANAVQANLNNAVTTLNKVVSKTDFLSTQIDGNIVATGTLIVGDAGGNNNAGITGVVDNASSSVRFWAGSSYAGRNLAPWRVLNNGKSYMTNVVISAGTTGRRAELDSANNVFAFFDDANRSLMSLKDNVATFTDDNSAQTQRQLAGIIFNKYYNSNSTNPDIVNITGNGVYSNAGTAAALNSNDPGAGTSVFASVIGYVRRAISYLAPGSFHAGIAGLANTPNSTGGYFKHMQGGTALTIEGQIVTNGRRGLSGVAYCSNVGNNVYNGIEFRDGLAVASGQYNLSSRPPGLS
ncbi:hypothetical protein [Pedobacter sp. MR2016-24]|uniref:hypothetical protein n=1 Tax=Pedobacter sp. MR2016-24 TaxID=2994466 RepID=UPI00224722B5|nr:hypothetical protein [Pedobacter sp. MR2016-24]MCX2484527.1 hypothetical protein [Pedobacter sp. MR2016-24]